MIISRIPFEKMIHGEVVGAQVGTLNINQQDNLSLGVRSAGHRIPGEPLGQECLSEKNRKLVWYTIYHACTCCFVTLFKKGHPCFRP